MGIDFNNLDLDLEKEYEEAKQYVADLEALIRVKSKQGHNSSYSSEKPNKPTLGETGAINLDELELPKKILKKKVTLLDNVKNVIERFGSQEFTVSHVDVALKQMGKGTNAKHFKNRVSVLIRKLTDEDFLTRTKVGFGNEPHFYRLKNPSVSLVKNES